MLRLLTCSTTPGFYLGAREHFTHLAICLAHLCSFNTHTRAHTALFSSVNFGISKPCHCYLCVYGLCAYWLLQNKSPGVQGMCLFLCNQVLNVCWKNVVKYEWRGKLSSDGDNPGSSPACSVCLDRYDSESSITVPLGRQRPNWIDPLEIQGIEYSRKSNFRRLLSKFGRLETWTNSGVCVQTKLTKDWLIPRTLTRRTC